MTKKTNPTHNLRGGRIVADEYIFSFNNPPAGRRKALPLTATLMTPKLLISILFSMLFVILGCNSQKSVVKHEKVISAIDTTKFYPVNSRDTLQSIYIETSKYLWQTYVPESGQAETKQGEFIRIIGKLDREIRENDKINWDEQFVLLANSLRDSLIASNTFPKEIQEEIRKDINSLTKSRIEFLDEDIFNRVTRRIIEWYWRHKDPIKHIKNEKLKR